MHKMKRYSEYKDSGAKWIGDIPKHWEVKKLRNLISMTSVKNHPNETLLSVVREQGVIVRDIEADDNHNFIPEDLSGYKLIEEGQFVINKMKAWQGSYAVSGYRGIVSPAYYTCDLRLAYKTFFNIAIRSCAYVPFFTQYSKGIRVGQWDLSPVGLKEIPFFLPPLVEQHAIVSYLDSKVGQIDTYVAKQTQQIELLKELKQTVIANAVTKGMANYNNHHTKLKQSGISWIGEIPEHWEVKRLGLFFTENKTINSCMQCTEAYKFNYGTLIRKDENIAPTELKDTYNKYTILRPRDIVINGLNLNYDFVSQRVALATTAGIITSAYIVLSPRTKVNELFFYYLFKSMDGMKLFHGMGTGIRLTLSFKDLRYQLLPIPPLSEQRAIVSYIEAKTASINKLIDAYAQQVGRVKEYKQRLISDAVTGKMNVTDEQTQTN